MTMFLYGHPGKREAFIRDLWQHHAMPRQPAVYILTNKPRGTLYVGVTSNLIKRIHEHRSDAVAGFTRRYNLKTLVYYELFNEMLDAIEREKKLKRWRRTWKDELIESLNPDWRDLWIDITGGDTG